MKVWITLCAITEGIHCAEVDAFGVSGNQVVDRSKPYLDVYGPGDWYPTPEAAIARARTMRDLEVTKLRREIARLEAMAFEVGA